MKSTRRDFAKLLGAAVALFGTSARAAETAPNPYAEMVRTEFGAHLTADDVEKIRKDFADSAPFLQKFRDVKLKNSDEPDFTFSVLAKR